MLVAGVDSSTQSTKVLLCDAADGTVVGRGMAPHPGGTECEPAAWWAALLTAGAGLLDRAAAIGVAGQQHGMIVLDDEGQVIRPALLWNDMRSAGAAAELITELGGARWWAEATGSVPMASFTVTKLRWLAEHEPDNARRVAGVLLPHDWLTWRLTGGDPVTDRGDASGTGYFSPATGQWLPDVAAAALGRPVRLPRVASPGEAVGRAASGMLSPASPAARITAPAAPTASAVSSAPTAPVVSFTSAVSAASSSASLLSEGTVVSAGTGDNMGAALGLGLAAGDVVISIGTSGTAYAVSEVPAADPTGAVAGFADATGRFLPLVCTVNAALVLHATAAMLGTDNDGLSRLALAAGPGAGGLTLLPYLDGERTPDRPAATGVLRGLTTRNATRENLARAAVEAVLASLAEAAGYLGACGIEQRRVLLIGGAARSEAVCRIAPGIFGAPVRVPAPEEYVALGAARQAAWALAGTAEPPRWPGHPAAEYSGPPEPQVRECHAALREDTAGWS
jgi:xylulokinase